VLEPVGSSTIKERGQVLAVDRVIAYLADGAASRGPGVALPWPLLPPGFAITGACRVGKFVRVEGDPDKICLRPDG
jgi:hypothetical protein